MNHKYLLEVFSEDKIPFPFNQESYSDFDERDTYSLDSTLVCWLYERLRFFQEKASKMVDFDFHTFDIDGKTLTQTQCIQRMIDDCKVIMTGDEFEDQVEMNAAKDDLFKVLSKVYWYMWW